MAAWCTVLAANGTLSDRFRTRYAIVLAQLEALAPEERIGPARLVAETNPHHAAGTLACGADHLVIPRQRVSEPTFDGTEPLTGQVRRLLAGRPDVESFLEAQQPLAQTAVPIHPSRQARLVPADDFPLGLVALRWSAASVSTRHRNEEHLADLIEQLGACGGLRFEVQTDYVLVRSEAGTDPWLLAPNLGQTVEDLLRSFTTDGRTRSQIVTALRALRSVMLETGVVWQGFAPRNMFLHDGAIILIDFEEVVDAAANPARAAECLLWHRIFFADSLTEDEANELFAADDTDGPVIADHQPLVADPFERALLGVDTVSWRQRRELLEQSLRIEGRHTRPDPLPDHGMLYGHELGHFWGDFLPVGRETRLFEHLAAVVEADTLVACLEAFEAAMEADICRSIRANCTGEADTGPQRTEALIDALDMVGPISLAAVRRSTGRWYERLSSDPARLVDELLFAVGNTVGEVDRSFVGTYLVGDRENRSAHERDLADAVRVGLDFLHGRAPEEPFLRHAHPSALQKAIERPLPLTGADFPEVLGEVDEVIARYSIGQSHTRYLAFPDSGNALASLAGSMLSPLLNQNLIAVDRSAPTATFVEVQVIEWLRELIGYDALPLTELRGVKDVAGLWTTGGHLSNHVAMLTALGNMFPEARKHGLRALGTQPTVVMAGPIAHYSHSDAAFHLGLGWDAVMPVRADRNFTTDPAAVDALLSDPPTGRKPFMVVGVAGNCRTTGLDDLEALGEVCRRHGVWFHVDACHGGSLIFNEKLRLRHLAGIEQADSVSLDPHKGLFTPYPSSYVVFRDRGVLTQFSRHEAAVMADGSWDLGLITPFLGSRGFHSLATWMLLRHMGTRTLGSIVEARQSLVRYLERRLDESGLFVRLNDVDFYRLAFVFCPPAARSAIAGLGPEARQRAAKVVSAFTSRINTSLYQAGEVCFDEHTLADLDNRVGAGPGTGYTIMAACPGNPLLTREDLDAAIERLLVEALPLAEPMLAEINEGRSPEEQQHVGGPAGWGDVE